MKYLRILHYLSPVRWDKNLFLADIDSNFKVVLKTIEFLPECHHYILMPKKHNFDNFYQNITLIPYNYPWSGVSSKSYFDYNTLSLSLDFTKLDIDFVFNHQSELTSNICTFFHAKRNFSNLKIYNFIHWLDLKINRVGGDKFNPIYFYNQISGMFICDKLFLHNNKVFDIYIKDEFKNRNLFLTNDNIIKNKIQYMPLSSTIDKIESEPFDLQTNKKIIVFNHRMNDSSNLKMFHEFYNKLDKNKYELWVTDNNAEEKFLRPRLNIHKYKYLLEQCYCSICFIDGYSTWNLSLQDSIRIKKPCLSLKHPVLKSLLGKNYPYYFTNLIECFNLLDNISEDFNYELEDFDSIFKNNLLSSLKKDFILVNTKQIEKIEKYKELISKKIREKKLINNTINPNLARSNGFSSIRNILLKNGFKDNYNSKFTEYYLPEEIIIQKNISLDFFKKKKTLF
jgi:hypothetical protein